MTFGISIETGAWRQHCDAFRDRVHASDAGLVPVIKGDGYGLGQGFLSGEAQRMGLQAVAVGTVHEVAEVAGAFQGDIIVLEPVDPRDAVAVQAWQALGAVSERVVRTVASPEGLDHVIDSHVHPRVVLEARTSLRRFGFEGPTLRETWAWATTVAAEGRLRVLGLTVHLPLMPSNADLDEVLQLADETGDPTVHVLLSHIDSRRLDILRRHSPHLRFSLRVGTALWLGLRGAITTEGTVLAVHAVRRGQPMGYHQRRARTNGYLLVVAGGTAHGVGLAAPAAARTARQRAISVANGFLEALGRARSPFRFAGQTLWFVEPPHQHVSLLWLPSTVTPPAVGSAVQARVRLTTTHADVVQLR